MEQRTPERFDLIISGASFAGLALARALLQALGPDVRIAMVDRAAGPVSAAQDRRAFAIWAGPQRVLETLGVWQTLAHNAQAVSSIEISDTALDDGVRPTRLSYEATTPEGRPAAWIVPAGALHDALYQSVAREPNISWIAPAEASGLSLSPQGAAVTLSDGRVLHAALCVAAEGRQSKLREAAGIKTTGWSYEQTGLVANIAFERPHHGVAIQHFLPGGPFAFLPLPGLTANITWSSDAIEAARVTALSDEAFLAELDKRIGGRFGALRLTGPRQSWPLNVKLARSLIAQRFALIGDAAHGVHPIAGQGVNLALKDVAALTEVLVDAARLGFDLGHGPALEAYSRWRRFDSTMSASLYDGLNRLFRHDNVLLRAARTTGLGMLDQLPPVKRWIMAEAAGITGDLPKLSRGLPV